MKKKDIMRELEGMNSDLISVRLELGALLKRVEALEFGRDIVDNTTPPVFNPAFPFFGHKVSCSGFNEKIQECDCKPCPDHGDRCEPK